MTPTNSMCNISWGWIGQKCDVWPYSVFFKTPIKRIFHYQNQILIHRATISKEAVLGDLYLTLQSKWYFYGFRKCQDYGKAGDTLAQSSPQKIKIQTILFWRNTSKFPSCVILDFSWNLNENPSVEHIYGYSYMNIQVRTDYVEKGNQLQKH